MRRFPSRLPHAVICPHPATASGRRTHRATPAACAPRAAACVPPSRTATDREVEPALEGGVALASAGDRCLEHAAREKEQRAAGEERDRQPPPGLRLEFRYEIRRADVQRHSGRERNADACEPRNE